MEIRVLGELEVALDGQLLPLPASKKTRALLAYLAISKREYQRNRLCEIFWEVPDDPRASLRWSLNKLRPLTNTGDKVRLVTDREHVALQLAPGELDLEAVRNAARTGIGQAPTALLAEAAKAFRGELLEGLDLPDCPLYFEWCKGERESIRHLHAQILAALIERTRTDAEQCLRYARQRVSVDPYAEDGQIELIRLLHRLGRTREAIAQYEDCRRFLEQELRIAPSPELERVRRELGSAPEPRAIRPAEPPARADRSFGRRRERELLEELLGARTPRPVVLLEGDPGIGKTRLLRDLVERVAANGGRALESRAFEAEMVRPYGVWIDALRADSAWAALAPELSTPSPAIISQTQVFEAVKRVIAGLTSGVVIIDDIQWIDEPSAALLHYVVRELAGAPILFALAARKGEVEDNPSAQRLVRALRAEGRLQAIELGPLDDSDIGSLVRSISARGDVEEVISESRGNPLVAIELAARPPNELSSARLEHLMLARLDRLPASARDIALWASAFGRPFTPELLSKAIGIAPGETVSAVAELERRGLIRPSRAAHFEYDFAHDVLRRCAYRQLSPPRRRMVHFHLAHALESSADFEALAFEVAHHAALGGDAALAASSYLAAGTRSLRLFARTEAARFARRGLEQLASVPAKDRLSLHIALLRITVMSGVEMPRAKELEGELSRLATEASRAGADRDAAQAQWLASLLNHEVGNFDAAGRAVLQMVATAASSKDPYARAYSLAKAGQCLAQIEHDFERAWRFLDEAATIAESEHLDVAEIDWGIGIVRHHLGEVDDACVRLAHALELTHRADDHWAECECLSRLAMIELERRRADRALEHCLALSQVATKMGDDSSEGVVAKALEALALRIAGEAGAEARIEEALVSLRTVDVKGMLAYALTFAALVDLDTLRVSLARARAEEALRAAEIARRPSLIAIAHAILARAGLAERAAASARNHLEQAQRLAAAPLGVSARARAVIADVEKAFAT